MFKNKKGFTLIELMIVVAIVGILAAVGLPAYQDYTIRAQVTEALTLADGLKTPVVDTLTQTGSFPANNNDANAAAANTIIGKYVSSVAIAAGGVITATMGNDANATISGGTVTLTPANNGGSVSWTCSSSVAQKYVPKSCQ